jgi:D,D-heptose 1,7-bisphosphate phosphatase
MKKAVFMDKDGTLVEDFPYNVDPENLRFTKGASFCLQRLTEAGYQFIIVSNQSGVARGYFEEKALDAVRRRLASMFADAGARLLDFCYCPHHPDGSVARYAVTCSCRKPKSGLLLKAALRHRIDLASSWMIGDILNDVEAGRMAGCRTILLNNGNETEWLFAPERIPDFLANDLAEAALIVTTKSGNDEVKQYDSFPRPEELHDE